MGTELPPGNAELDIREYLLLQQRVQPNAEMLEVGLSGSSCHVHQAAGKDKDELVTYWRGLGGP